MIYLFPQIIPLIHDILISSNHTFNSWYTGEKRNSYVTTQFNQELRRHLKEFKCRVNNCSIVLSRNLSNCNKKYAEPVLKSSHIISELNTKYLPHSANQRCLAFLKIKFYPFF